MKRRHFLDLGVGAAAYAMGSRLVWASDEPALDPGLLIQGANPQNLGTPEHYFDRAIIPNDVFFVRSHFGPPAYRPQRTLKIHGAVQRPVTLNVDDLKRFTEVTTSAVLQCAGNGRALHTPRVPGLQWVHGAMGQAKWTGVRLADVLEAAGLASHAQHVILRGADAPPKPTVPAFVRSLALARALDPSTLLVYRMNDEPLPLAHGGPLRLVIPGWAGDHWIKWLCDLNVSATEAEGFFMKTAYRMPRTPVAAGSAVPAEQTVPATTFPIKSILGRPAQGAVTKVGPQELVGVAFAGDAVVKMVEVSLDDGQSWQRAQLEGEAGVGRWQVFRYRFTAKRPGPQSAWVRATDSNGVQQPKKPEWNPSGYFWNGWHHQEWSVIA